MARTLIIDYQPEEQHASLLGGKALHLFHLERWGLRVPSFIVLSAEAFSQWRANNETLPKDIAGDLKRTIDNWNIPYFAVRSSMSAEDGAEASYAGMMDTFLYVPPDQLLEAINGCFRSASSNRAKMYHEKHNQAREHESAAVVIQEMVASDASGVAFSRAPVGDSSLCYIESGLGLGEGVVSGTVEVDRFYADRWDHVIETHVSEKRKMVAHNPAATSPPHTHEVEITPQIGDVVSLDSDMVCEIARATLTIEKKMGLPADVEWAVHNNTLYILQARPITTDLPNLEYFIDTNLSESYPGLISPMGASFVRRVYEMVHFNGGEILGFSKERQQGNAEFYRTLVTNIGGHLYYNLRSYYRMMLSVPGGQTTLDNWHRMIGGARNDFVTIDDAPKPSLQETLTYAMAILNLIFRHKSIFDDFCDNKHRLLRESLEKFKTIENPQELLKALNHAIYDARDFSLTALNDLLIMLSTRKIVDLLAKHGYPETLLPTLIVTEEGVESLKPLTELDKICGQVREPERLTEVFRAAIENEDPASANPYADVYAAFIEAGFELEKDLIEEYLRVYGHRSFEELKLESLAFNQSPQEFFKVFSWKLRTLHHSSKVRPSGAEESETVQLSGLARWWIGILVGLAQRTIATREETRFIRGAYYGMVRTGILATLRCLRSTHPEHFGQMDVTTFFGLTQEELFEFSQGELSAEELAKRANDNAAWKDGPHDFPEFFCQHRDASGADAWFFRAAVQVEENFEAEDGLLGAGLGAAPGRIEGIPLAISNPREALDIENLNEYILVTKNTDPAWVFIMAQCAGLVSEKGSLLSHTAIIGRELGIPTVVGVKNAVSRLRGRDRIILDGNTGKILIVEPETG